MPDRTYEIDPNPYAASAVAEPYDRREYGAPSEVGLWRDGQLVVMHVDARWPAICIKTGEPAVGSHGLRITRMVPGSWWRSEQIYITVRLGPRWHWLVTRFRWAAYAVGAALLPGLLLFSNLQPHTFPLELLTCATLGTVMAFVIGGSLGDTVVLKRSRGSYLWLSGAREPFLAQLPPWPSG